MMFKTKLVLRNNNDNIELIINKPNSQQAKSIYWKPNEYEKEKINEIRSTFDVLSAQNTISLFGASNSQTAATMDEDMLCFPCILLRAKYDLFTVVHNPQMFFTCDVIQYANKASTYCSQELWELCHASDAAPGDVLPVDCIGSPNMVLSLGHTPLLYQLFKERGRAFQSGINITGDCMSLCAVTFQWAKFFHDVLLNVPTDKNNEQGNDKVCLYEGLRSAVSFSYAIQDHEMAPAINTLNSMFSHRSESDNELKSVDKESSTSLLTVISRESSAGLTCPISVAALVCDVDSAYASDTSSWNLVLFTIFSRMCEGISGHKVIRKSTNSKNASESENAERSNDLGELEENYRYKLGELQTLVRSRLHIEWSNSSHEQKLAIIATCSTEVLACLQSIVVEYLQLFNAYGLPSWSSIVLLISKAIHIRNYGMVKLRSDMESLQSIDDLVASLHALNFDRYANSLILPVVSYNSTTNSFHLREVTSHDIDHCQLISYINAIVATKASPKIKYVRIMNPSFPTFSNTKHNELKFQFDRSSFNMELPCANVAFIGNVNSGKSSLGGHLLELLNVVPPGVTDKLAHEAEIVGYSPNVKHAWILDSTKESRARGRTINCTFTGFQTNSRRFTTIDNPGHKDFCKNAAIGIFHSDMIVLVTSAVMSEIELAELSRSQAEEQLVTAFCFGVRNIIVAINKMDLVNYDQNSFISVQKHMTKLIVKAGFKATQAIFIPVSAVQGDCILSDSSNMQWYRGPSLLQAMDEAPLPVRHTEKTFRLVVEEVKKIHGIGQVVCGRVERGVIKVQDNISFFPDGPKEVRVFSIETHHRDIKSASPGDDVGIALKSKKENLDNIRRGMIVGLTSNPPVGVMHHFEVQILVLRGSSIKVGYIPVLTMHLASVPATVVKILQIIGRDNAVIESNPESVAVGQTCICELQALKPFAAETVHDAPRLSRFLIKEMRSVRALGFIKAKIL
jgi:elongation factor 1-alpha